MNKISSLTPEQEAQLAVYRDKYINIGLSTDQVTLERAIEIVHPLQEMMGRKKTPVVIFDNPVQAWLAVCMLAQVGEQIMDSVQTQVLDQVRDQVWEQVLGQVRYQIWDQVWVQVGGQVRDQVLDQVRGKIRNLIQSQFEDHIQREVEGRVRNKGWAQVGWQVKNQVHGQVWDQVQKQVRDKVRGQVLNQVGGQVLDQVRDQVLDQVRDQVWEQVLGQVRYQIWDQVWEQVWGQVGVQVLDQVRNQFRGQVRDQLLNQIRDEVLDFVAPYLCGSFDSYIFSFYRFFKEVVGVKIPDDLWDKFKIWEATLELGFIWPLEHVCVVCQKPTVIRRNEMGLHCDGDAALEYNGWKMYALNGVRVPEYLAVTPSGQLDIEFFHKETNADVRTEFVRKYGVERMLSLGKKIDTYENYDEEWWTKSEYELWDMAALFSNLDYQPYLKMLNQTTGVWHVEAVSPECRTLRDAIKERFGGRDFTIKAIA